MNYIKGKDNKYSKSSLANYVITLPISMPKVIFSDLSGGTPTYNDISLHFFSHYVI